MLASCVICPGLLACAAASPTTYGCCRGCRLAQAIGSVLDLHALVGPHGDIKPPNFVVGAQACVGLVDLGGVSSLQPGASGIRR